MKKLIIKIGNETHEFPYNGETFSFEVSNKYVPKVGDCVKVECRNPNRTTFYWFKVREVAQAMVDFSFAVEEDLSISKNGFFCIDDNRIYTQITPEELKAKYAEAGYDWDCESDTVEPIKWMSKEIENYKTALELAKSKLQVAEKALNDIVKWDDDLEDEWGDPGERANAALEKIMILDGF